MSKENLKECFGKEYRRLEELSSNNPKLKTCYLLIYKKGSGFGKLIVDGINYLLYHVGKDVEDGVKYMCKRIGEESKIDTEEPRAYAKLGFLEKEYCNQLV